MGTFEILLEKAKNKDTLISIIKLLSKSIEILSIVETSSPAYAKRITKILQEFDSIIDNN